MQANDSYKPEGWNDERVVTAAVQMSRFLDTEAYRWIANYIGVLQRHAERDIVPARPAETTHGKYVECASRIGTLNDVMHGITYLCAIKEKKDA